MSYTQAKDISKWQGNWQDTGEQIVMIKMSGGDNGLYMDSKASENYQGAVAAGRAVAGYHFGGGDQSAEAEASFFLRAMSPVAENDVFSLDVEASLAEKPDVVQWCDDFIDYLATQNIHGGLLYMNLATLSAHDWSGPLSKWGLWLADWAVSPNANIPTHYTYVMQQYSDGPNYDHDAWFGTVDQFKAYGYHAPQPAPVVEPTPDPVIVTPPVVVPDPVIPPVVEPPVVSPNPVVDPVTPVATDPTPIVVETPQKHWYDFILNFIAWLVS